MKNLKTSNAVAQLKKDHKLAKFLNKRNAIKTAATDLMVEYGYENTSLEAICERASCSKSAIYEHFGNKQGLLAALTEDVALELSQALHAFYLQERSVEDTLLLYAELALTRILNDKHIAIVRATISSLPQDPQIGPTYYKVGAGTAQAALEQYFSAQIKLGTLILDDPQWAAHEFQGLLFWERLMAQIVGAMASPSETEVKTHARQVVDTFLRRYRVDA
ncbi:MAG: hypothetical protein COA71_08345 [SAR86 cluster bacterium]|uniref:HTH tetR-type domain-containing protein n=1 Tax=SAR86 cluster bacterium TaxID=2030880 RepID=A0A2A5CDU8_9GAMM|nr:MAG: hypothetical protein COA71_08345 [SAR86 cluster bacterium]